jgi:bifunctional oligoribonuclease and PAP phosphatase NrnA
MNISSRPTINPDADNTDIKRIGQKISGFLNFKIFTHKNPDGDAVGSMLAFEKILQTQKKAAEMFVFGEIADYFHFLPGFDKIKTQKEFSAEDDSLFVYIDCSSPRRTGFDLAFFDGRESLVLDHHLTSAPEPNSFGIIDPGASSTAEIIFSLSDELNWKINRDISFCLLAGILSDTGTFQHANTSPKAFTIVSRLLRNGLNLKKIADNLSNKKEASGALKIWGEVLARVSVDERTKMAFSFVSEEDLKKHNSTEDELGGLVNLLAGIPESKFSMLLIENELGKIKASLRSEHYKGVDVAKIAQSFGGGGHKLAAGFEVEGRIESEMELIKEKIAKEIEIY